MPNILEQHLAALNPAQRDALAVKAGSTAASLRMAAKGYKTNRKLDLTAEFAARIEKATRGAVPRTQTCHVCAKCPHVADKA